MEAIVQQVQTLAAAASTSAHGQLVDTLRRLLYSIETPIDMTHRLAYGQFQMAVARIAQNTPLIEILVKHQRGGVTIAELAKTAKVSPLLAGRLLRYMAAYGMVTQLSPDTFAANKLTESLDMPGARAGLGFGIDIVSPSAQALPEFLQQTNYENPKDMENCAWHPVHDPDRNVMQFLFSNPRVLKDFNVFMTSYRLNSLLWTDSYPVDLSRLDPEQGAFFVDVGGGVGHMCVKLKEKHPNLPGRMVLQDLPPTIESLSPDQKADFDAIGHDYYTEQPVRGARYYFFRHIMHNLADKDAARVLTQTKAALGAGSKILVDDAVMPAVDAHWSIVNLDLLMMSALGAMERTQAQWDDLFASVGLRVAKVYNYDSVGGDSILEVVPT